MSEIPSDYEVVKPADMLDDHMARINQLVRMVQDKEAEKKALMGDKEVLAKQIRQQHLDLDAKQAQLEKLMLQRDTNAEKVTIMKAQLEAAVSLFETYMDKVLDKFN